MKLAIVNYNRGYCPKTLKEMFEKSSYTRKDVVNYLEQNPGGICKIDNNGICEKKYIRGIKIWNYIQ